MIVFSDSSLLDHYSAFMTNKNVRGKQRETLELHFRQEDNPHQELSYQWLRERFADGTSISICETVRGVGDDGQEREAFHEYPYPEHTIAGPITDNMDGSYIVCLCRKTEAEMLEEMNAQLILALGGAADE